MPQPSFGYDTKYEIERLWAAVRELNRKRSRRPPNLRDLQDVNGWGAEDGSLLKYSTSIGRWKPAPPTTSTGFRAARTIDQSLLANTFTKIVFDGIVDGVNEDDSYDTATGVWTVPRSDWYIMYVQISTGSMANGERLVVVLESTARPPLYLHDNYQGAAGSVIYTYAIPHHLVAGEQIDVVVLRQFAGTVVAGSAFSSVRLP